MFLEKDLELSKEEYFRLLRAAGKGSRLQAVMETIAATGILVIQGCRTDLIGAAPTVNSSLTGLILEIKMKPGEIDRHFKALHL